MQTLNFSTLHVSVDRASKSLWATMKRPSLSAEVLFELESLLHFLSQHIEISSFVLKGMDGHFGRGFDGEEILRGDMSRQKKYILHLQKVMVGLMHLPQTVVADLGAGASGASFELSLGADLRVAHEEASFGLNQLAQGHVPSNGGINLLAALTSPTLAQSWVMSGKNVRAKTLIPSGLIFDCYENNGTILELLSRIALQAPIARIQAKRAFLEGLKDAVDLSLSVDFGLFLGAQVFDDWKKFLEAQNKQVGAEFTQAKELKSLLREQQPQA